MTKERTPTCPLAFAIVSVMKMDKVSAFTPLLWMLLWTWFVTTGRLVTLHEQCTSVGGSTPAALHTISFRALPGRLRAATHRVASLSSLLILDGPLLSGPYFFWPKV